MFFSANTAWSMVFTSSPNSSLWHLFFNFRHEWRKRPVDIALCSVFYKRGCWVHSYWLKCQWNQEGGFGIWLGCFRLHRGCEVWRRLCPQLLSCDFFVFVLFPSWPSQVSEFISLSPYYTELLATVRKWTRRVGVLTCMGGSPYLRGCWKDGRGSSSLSLLLQVQGRLNQTLIADDHSLSSNEIKVRSWFNTIQMLNSA